MIRQPASARSTWPNREQLAAAAAPRQPFALQPGICRDQGGSQAQPGHRAQKHWQSALSLGGAGQGIVISGANATSFAQTNTCGKSVAAGASCAITVTFKPAATGTLAAVTVRQRLAVAAIGEPHCRTGTPGLPAIYVGAQSISFGATSVGATNMSGHIAINSTGYAPISFTGISLTGANASSFSQTNTCGKTLAVGAGCSVTITFKPTKTGTLSATLDIADNVKGSPQTIALSGTGK